MLLFLLLFLPWQTFGLLAADRARCGATQPAALGQLKHSASLPPKEERRTQEQATDSSVNCTSRGRERLTGTQPVNWKSVAKCFVCSQGGRLL